MEKLTRQDYLNMQIENGRIRKEKGYTTDDIAKRAYTSSAVIRRYERGQSVPQAQLLNKLYQELIGCVATE